MSNPTSPSEPTDLNPLAIIETLDRHHVNYLLVGGLGAAVHGATRPTYDFDALAERTDQNLDRVAKALNELGAFYRVGGLTDDAARALPTVIDRHTLLSSTIITSLGQMYWGRGGGGFRAREGLLETTSTRSRTRSSFRRRGSPRPSLC